MNSGGRDVLKKSYAIVLASVAVPADYKVTTVKTYLDNADSSKVVLAAGASYSPSTTVSGMTTEGNSEVQTLDISDGGTWNLLEMTPEEYETFKTKYNGQKVRVAALAGDPDVAYDETTEEFNPTVGDKFEYSHIFKLRCINNPVDSAEWQAGIFFSKSVDPDLDTLPVYTSVIEDTEAQYG